MTVEQFYLSVGGNYQEALSRMMNDAFIKRMLTKFLEKNSYQAVVDAYHEKNPEKVFEMAHSLKGVSGNLSLTSLFDLSSKITEEVRGKKVGDPFNIEKDMEDLQNLYQKIISELQILLA